MNSAALLYVPLCFTTMLLLTVAAHIAGRLFSRAVPSVAVVLSSLVVSTLLLYCVAWPYNDYLAVAKPLFSHLLGYIMVAMAIPIAYIKWSDYPVKPLFGLLAFANIVGVVVPMGLAIALGLSTDLILSFASRAVTTPIALGIADVLHTPVLVVVMIAIISGVAGGAITPMLHKRLANDKALGLAVGIMAHAIGTAQAYQVSATAGKYAALGMAINGVLTALWVPWVVAMFWHIN